MPQRIQGDRVLLSTAEAQRQSGLGQEYIQRLLRHGRLQGMKLGHDWLVYEDSLVAFLAEPRKPGPKGPRKKAQPKPESGETHSQTSSSEEPHCS